MAIHVLTPKLAGQPAGRCKSHTKIAFLFQKECGRPYRFLQERPTELAGLIVHASFILGPPYLAIGTSLYISLII